MKKKWPEYFCFSDHGGSALASNHIVPDFKLMWLDANRVQNHHWQQFGWLLFQTTFIGSVEHPRRSSALSPVSNHHPIQHNLRATSENLINWRLWEYSEGQLVKRGAMVILSLLSCHFLKGACTNYTMKSLGKGNSTSQSFEVSESIMHLIFWQQGNEVNLWKRRLKWI